MQQGFAVAPYQETAHAHALVQAQQQQHQYQQRVPQPGQLAQPHQQQCTPVKRPSTAGMVLEVRSLELQLLQYKALKDETAACAAQARATLQALQAQGIQPGAPLHPQSAAAASVAALEQLQARQRMLTDELAAQRPHMAAAAQRIQQLKAEGRVLAQLAATAGALLAAAGGGNGGGSAFVS